MHEATDNAADRRIRIRSVQTDRKPGAARQGTDARPGKVHHRTGTSKGRAVNLAGRSKTKVGCGPDARGPHRNAKLAVAAGEGARRSRAVSAGEREKLGDIPANSGMVATVCPVSTLEGSVAILRLEAGIE